jgi:hypothetical protein
MILRQQLLNLYESVAPVGVDVFTKHGSRGALVPRLEGVVIALLIDTSRGVLLEELLSCHRHWSLLIQ